MSLYKRGGVWWYDFTDDSGERHRKSTKQTDKAAARKYERDARNRAELGKVPEAITLREGADKWFAARQADKRSAATTAQRVVILLRCMGDDTLIPDIDEAVIEDAMGARRLEPLKRDAARSPSNSTVNRDIIDTTLRPILKYAKNPLKQAVQDIDWKAVKLAEPPGRDRKFTAAEMAAWRDNLPDWHRAPFDFFRRYGVRLKEAFFPIANVDLETGRVFVRKRKNGRAHTVRLLPDDRTDLAARIGRAEAAGLATPWFRDQGGELSPISWRGFQSASYVALRRAGIEDAKPVHDLRHHAANELMRGTGNLAAVKRLLGHENIQSTMRYVHADDDDVFEALRHTYVTEADSEETKPNDIKPLTGSSTGT